MSEEHACLPALLYCLGFGKTQWNFIRHFPEPSTCTFLEHSLFGSGEVPHFEEHRCQGPGCFDDLLAHERRYCLPGKMQSEEERLRILWPSKWDRTMALVSLYSWALKKKTKPRTKTQCLVINIWKQIHALRLCCVVVGMGKITVSRRTFFWFMFLLGWGVFHCEVKITFSLNCDVHVLHYYFSSFGWVFSFLFSRFKNSNCE